MGTLHVCPDCLGDGYFIDQSGAGTFSRSFGNYLPDEREVTCERCEGAGEIYAEPCPGCSGPMDDGADPHCPRCGSYLSELEEELERLTAEYDALVEEQEADEGRRILEEAGV